MSQVWVRNFSVSPDGFGTGEGQRLDAPPDSGQLSGSGHLGRPSSGEGGSAPAAGRADRASLMAQPSKDGTPGTVSHE